MKNFLYNKSDIFVAVFIIVIAVLVIYTRVDAIMGGAAGSELNGSELTQMPTVQTDPGAADASEGPGDMDGITPDNGQASPGGVNIPDAANQTDPADATDANADGPADTAEPADSTDAEPVLFTVEVGTATSTIAKNLAASGLVLSSDAFLKEVARQKAETKMKAGTFKITPGSSVSEVVKILTK
ncbi:MAG: hypothetical protein LBN35_02870 [Clostridiales Family XIII bacterium]|jgi:hypothetical protein|nr:hypothetical protein [Clostridiales Family XIII bacterium]